MRLIVRRAPYLALLALLLRSDATAAQAGVLVRGVVYDSLRSMPLAGAMLSVRGDPRTVVADRDGRFMFENVAPGMRTFVAQHDSLESIGFSGLTARVALASTDGLVAITVPSFATLWRITCGSRPAPVDSGLIYGTVRTYDDRVLTGASVDVAWIDLRVGQALDMSQKRWTNSALTDDRGGYALCGVPLTSHLRLVGNTDSLASGLLDLPIAGLKVRRQDLTLGPVGNAPTSLRGTITGTLSTETGGAFANARVQVDGVPEVRTNARGQYVLREVPVGTRQMEILALGMHPIVVAVNVHPNDTTNYSAVVRKVTVLEAMQVTATPRQRRAYAQLESRKRGGLGYVRDSSAFHGNGTMAGLFASMPGVRIERARGARFYLTLPARMGGQCAAVLYIDGVYENDFDALNFLLPDEIAAIEVYPRSMSVPFELMAPRQRECGSIAVWTKRFLQ